MTKTLLPSNSTNNGLNSSIFAEDPKWYAVYTKYRFEKKLYQDLQKSKLQAFLPLVKEKRVWSDRLKTVLVPLLPSYVFVKLRQQNIHQIYNYPGVVRLVSFEGKPCEIKEEEIGLLEKIIAHDFPVQTTLSCGIGDSVRIVQGPLKGWEGKVETTKGESRIVFQITSILQSISVEVEMKYVERIN
jgi:transcription antitermination factor NusG